MPIIENIQEIRRLLEPDDIDRLKRWIKELRTTKKKQGKGYLRKETKEGVFYCCMGIECELNSRKYRTPEEGAGESIREYKTAHRSFHETHTHTTAFLPTPLAGRTNPLLFHPKEGKIGCAQANDELHLSFQEIADLLELTYLTNIKEVEKAIQSIA